MGERKKVEESFCLRLERREEKEEDTMLCWNIQRKRLLTQVKAPRGLILVFIRHHTKKREEHKNTRKLIRAPENMVVADEGAHMEVDMEVDKVADRANKLNTG